MATGVGLDQSASSLEFTLTGSSKIELYGSWSNHSEDVYFTVYINGARQNKRVKFTYLDRTAVIAEGLNYKNTYTIKLVRETEEKYGQFVARSLNIGYLGRMLDAPGEEGLYVEFIGDSITCGLGSLCGYLSDDGLTVLNNQSGEGSYKCGIESSETSFCEDATNSYAYLAAQTLNADCKFISYSGIGVYKGYGSFQMGEYFEQHKSTDRVPDLVVINLGTNDFFKNLNNTSFNYDAYKTAVKDLIDEVRTAYGENTKILWATGLMNESDNRFMTAIDEEITKLKADGYKNLYYFGELTKSSGGHNGHPTKEGAKVAAKELVDYIVNNGILADKDNALTAVSLKDTKGNAIDLSGYSLTWYDGFSSSSLDLSQWNQTLGTGTRSQKVVDGLGENLHFEKDEEAGTDNLVMSSVKKSDSLYTRPRDVSTENRMAYKYGYLEIRAKVPHGRPAYPAFWMKSNLTIDKANAAPYMTEVDIFEIMASDTISPNIHKWTSGYTYSEQAVSKDGPMNGTARKTLTDDDYHTYGFMITPEGVGFYFDGECYLEVSADKNSEDYNWWLADRGDTSNKNIGLNDYFFIIFGQSIVTQDSVWKPYEDSYVTSDHDSLFPMNFAIDYIRLYQDDQGDIFYGQLPK